MIKFPGISLLIALSLWLCSSVWAGGVKGTAVYEGEVPKFREIKMDADPVCSLKHDQPVYPQTLVLGEGNTMGNVFVYIKKGLPSKQYSPPSDPVVITQKGCMYDPHVLGVMAGQPIKILNPDGTLHNVHAMPKVNSEFNLAMPKFRKETTKVFEKPEFMFPIKCDVHPWMSAWITVMPHPYFTVTKENGVFEIADLPPGEYTIEAWHEKLGTKTTAVTVAEDSTSEAHFVFSRPSK